MTLLFFTLALSIYPCHLPLVRLPGLPTFRFGGDRSCPSTMLYSLSSKHWYNLVTLRTIFIKLCGFEPLQDPVISTPAVMPYAKLQLAAAKRAEAAEKANRSKPVSRLLIRKPLTVDHYFFSNAQVCWYYIFFKCTGMLILYFSNAHSYPWMLIRNVQGLPLYLRFHLVHQNECPNPSPRCRPNRRQRPKLRGGPRPRSRPPKKPWRMSRAKVPRLRVPRSNPILTMAKPKRSLQRSFFGPIIQHSFSRSMLPSSWAFIAMFSVAIISPGFSSMAIARIGGLPWRQLGRRVRFVLRSWRISHIQSRSVEGMSRLIHVYM